MNWYKTAQEEITVEMVKDPNCPPEVLTEALTRGKDNVASYWATINPNTPPEALANAILTRDGLDAVASYVARNPNCPPEALAEVLTRGKVDNVSYSAITNPNCPLKAKIDWMEKVLLSVIIKNQSLGTNNDPVFMKLFEELKGKSFLLSVLWKKDYK